MAFGFGLERCVIGKLEARGTFFELSVSSLGDFLELSASSWKVIFFLVESSLSFVSEGEVSFFAVFGGVLLSFVSD